MTDDDEVFAERFYYKDGESQAVTTKEDFAKIYNGELSSASERLLDFLNDVSGVWYMKSNTIQFADHEMPWFSDPIAIMDSFNRHHEKMEDIY
jgi:hypothetical protein